jgi:hypothetical protein
VQQRLHRVPGRARVAEQLPGRHVLAGLRLHAPVTQVPVERERTVGVPDPHEIAVLGDRVVHRALEPPLDRVDRRGDSQEKQGDPESYPIADQLTLPRKQGQTTFSRANLDRLSRIYGLHVHLRL